MSGDEVRAAVGRIVGSRTATAGLVAVLALTAAVQCWSLAHGDALQDFSAYRRGVWGLVHLGDPYSVRARGSLLPFIYPPFAAIALTPLAVWSADVAEALMSAVSLASLAFVSWAVARAAIGRGGPPAVWLAAATYLVAQATEPVWATLGLGQVNLLLAALVVLDAVVLGERRGAGVATGIAAGIKLTPAFFIVYLLVIGRPRAALTAAVTAAGTVALSLAVAPGPTWRYVRNGDFLFSTSETAKAANQSVDGVLVRMLGDSTATTVLWAVLAAAVVAGGLWVARAVRHEWGDAVALGVAAVTALTVAPTSWTHYWVWWIVVAVPIAARAVQRQSAAAAAAALALVVTFVVGRWWFPPYPETAVARTNVGEAVLDDLYVVVGLAVVVGFGRVAGRARRVPDQPASGESAGASGSSARMA